jgi:hypothetical protein
MIKNSSKRKWTSKQWRFIQWQVLQEQDRNPSTQAELAQELNLRRQTLNRWKQMPGFWNAVEEEAICRLVQRTSHVLEMIGKKAESGDYRFAKLLLEINEKNKHRQTEEIIPFTIEEIKKVDLELKAWEDERFGTGRS